MTASAWSIWDCLEPSWCRSSLVIVRLVQDLHLLKQQAMCLVREQIVTIAAVWSLVTDCILLHSIMCPRGFMLAQTCTAVRIIFWNTGQLMEIAVSHGTSDKNSNNETQAKSISQTQTWISSWRCAMCTSTCFIDGQSESDVSCSLCAACVLRWWGITEGNTHTTLTRV